MAIPDFQSMMLPLLRLASDGKDHQVSEAIEHLALEFQVAVEDRKELLPSGTQRRFDNRVAWGRSYLKQALLLEFPRRGSFRITERGQQVLAVNPNRIDIGFLMQFPEFVQFKKGSQPVIAPIPDDTTPIQTPEEVLESSYQSLRSELAQDLLGRIKASPPDFFELLVIDLLVAMGYGGSRRDAGQAIGKSGDGGIDGIIKEDRLGLDAVYIQAKRWDNTVGRPTVQAFAGSLAGYHANKGVLITTSVFSQDARDYVRNLGMKIVLVDGVQLADLMIEHDVAVTEVASYVVKKVNLDYFDRE